MLASRFLFASEPQNIEQGMSKDEVTMRVSSFLLSPLRHSLFDIHLFPTPEPCYASFLQRARLPADLDHHVFGLPLMAGLEGPL